MSEYVNTFTFLTREKHVFTANFSRDMTTQAAAALPAALSAGAAVVRLFAALAGVRGAVHGRLHRRLAKSV